MALDGCVEGLASIARSKVEGVAPSPLVDIGDQVVVAANHVRVALLAGADAAPTVVVESAVLPDVVPNIAAGVSRSGLNRCCHGVCPSSLGSTGWK